MSGGLSGRYLVQAFPTTTSVAVYDGTAYANKVTAFVAGVSRRYYSYWSGPTMTVAYVGSSESSGAFDGTMETTLLRLGDPAMVQPNTVLKQICLDNSSTRCR